MSTSYNNGNINSTFGSTFALTASYGLTLTGSLYGRNDGATFANTSAPHCIGTSLVGLYPATAYTYTNGTMIPYTFPTSLSNGVWLLSGNLLFNKVTASYTTASVVQCSYDVITDITQYPTPTYNSNGSCLPIPSTSTSTLLVVPLQATTLVVTNSATPIISYGGTGINNSRIGLNISLTKIA